MPNSKGGRSRSHSRRRRSTRQNFPSFPMYGGDGCTYTSGTTYTPQVYGGIGQQTGVNGSPAGEIQANIVGGRRRRRTMGGYGVTDVAVPLVLVAANNLRGTKRNRVFSKNRRSKSFRRSRRNSRR